MHFLLVQLWAIMRAEKVPRQPVAVDSMHISCQGSIQEFRKGLARAQRENFLPRTTLLARLLHPVFATPLYPTLHPLRTFFKLKIAKNKVEAKGSGSEKIG